MKKNSPVTPDAENLRKKAEEIVAKKALKTDSHLSESELQKIIFELEVHKIELELQNEELERSFSETQDAINLYDFVPVGCYTLTRDGKIIRVNNNGLTILDKDILSIINRSFSSFVTDDSRPDFNLFLDSLFKNKTKSSCDVELTNDSNKQVFIQLTGNISENTDQCVIAAVDITARKQSEKAFQDIFSLTEATLESIHNGILVIDNEGKVVKTNARFSTMWHIPQDILSTGDDKTLLDFIVEQLTDPDEFLSKVKTLYSNLETESLDLVYFKDGRIFERISKPMYIGSKPEARVWSFLDITERKRAENALCMSEAKYKTLVENTGTSILIIEEDSTISFANERFMQRTGYSRSEIEGVKKWSDIVAKDDVDWMISNHQKRRKVPGFTTPNYEFRYDTKSGETRYAIVNVQLLPDSQKSIASIIDITERKQAEKALAQTRQNYETFFNTIDELLFVLDEQGSIIHTNKTVLDRLGYAEEELLGKSVLTVHPPERREEAGRIVVEMLEGKTEFCPVPVLTKSGIQIPVETRVTNGFWDGKPVIFGVTKDISQVKLSEEKYSKLFHNNSSACGLSELETEKYIEVNDAFTTLFGYTREEAIGKSAMDLGILTPELAIDLLQKVGEKNKISNLEISLRAKNGDIKHVLLSGENIYIQDKKYRYTIVEDITERKQAEELLRASEEKYKTLFENTGTAVLIIEEDNTINLVNDEFARLTGYTKDETEGIKKWIEIADKEDTGWMLEKYRLLRENPVQEMPVYEFRYRTKSGELRYALSHIQLLPGTNKSIASLIDITERKQAEIKVKESELRYKSLFETSPSGVMVFDEMGIILEANQAISETTFYTRDELTGSNLSNLAMPGQAYIVDENIQRMLAGEILEHEIQARRKDGTSCDLFVREASVILPNGKKGILSVSNDITKRKQAEKMLRLSEERFRKLFENSFTGIMISKPDGEILAANPEACRMFDRTEAEICRIGRKGVVNQLDPRLSPALEKRIRTGHFQGELAFVRRDGTIFPVEVISSVFTDSSGEKHANILFQDITEKKREEDLLRENETRFRNIADTAPVMIWMTGADSLCTYVNKPWLDFTGRELEEELGIGWAKDIHPDDYQHCTDIFQGAFAVHSKYTMEYRLRRVDGEYRWLLENGVPWFASDGNFLGYIGSCVDITEGKLAIDELKQSEAKFRDLFEANTDGITVFLLDENGPPSAIIDLNENAAKMLGYSKEEMLFLNPEKIEVQQTSENIEKRIKELKLKGHHTFETKLLHKDGHEIDVEVKVLVVRYLDQSVLMNISRDISERKKNEIQLQNYAHELSKQIAEKDKFFSIIAHDLRGPIGGFMGLTEKMAEGMKDMTLDELQNIARVMKNSSSNIYSLLGNLLEWSRMQRGLTTYEPITVRLLPKIQDILMLTLESANKKEITINNSIPEDIVVFADENVLASIIRNIVANAVKFTPRGGSINLSAKAISDTFISISLSDNGVGMDKELIDNLFNLDVNTNRKGTEGELSTGLGLMICKDFIVKHGGEFKIESEVGKGSIFRFTLPVTP